MLPKLSMWPRSKCPKHALSHGQNREQGTDALMVPPHLTEISSSRPEPQPRKAMKRMNEGRSDFHRHPPCQSARRQDLKAGSRSSHTLYTASQRETATFAGRSRVESANCWASRGYKSSTRVGSVAPLRNTKEDDYYRNDSMK